MMTPEIKDYILTLERERDEAQAEIDRLRGAYLSLCDRNAELEMDNETVQRDVVKFQGMYKASCDRIAAQSELLSQRAEREQTH